MLFRMLNDALFISMPMGITVELYQEKINLLFFGGGG